MSFSVNSFLLSIFAKNFRFGSDITSSLKRYEILSLIYVYLLIATIIMGYDFIAAVFLKYPEAGCYTLIATPYIILIAVSLLNGKDELAAALCIPYTNSISLVSVCYFGYYLPAILGILFFTNLLFFIRLSIPLHAINILISTALIIYSQLQIHSVFKITLTKEQEIQIQIFVTCCLICYFMLCIAYIAQKIIAANVWNLANKNFEKSEALTKEVFQAAVAKDTFINSLSHEIRNPLNSMKGSIDYLLSVVKNPTHQQMLQNARLSGEVLLNLVNNVLDAAKLKSEMMEISKIESSFENIIKKVFIINSESMKRKDIKATAFLDEHLPKSLWIDPCRILQIMMNLFSNAIKFTPSHGQIAIYASWCSHLTSKEDLLTPFKMDLSQQMQQSQSTVDTYQEGLDQADASMDDYMPFEEFNTEELKNRTRNFNSMKGLQKKPGDSSHPSLILDNSMWSIVEEQLSGLPKSAEGEKETGYLKIQISDTGCGIPKENIPKLFDMFFQVQGENQMKTEGAGLGLWISRQLCHKMGGDIQVYSEFCKGTTFVFYIPVSQCKLDELRETRATPKYHNLNVLIADDFEYNRELHKLLLEQEGANVTLAVNGKDAIEKFKEKPEGFFDLLMFDVQMPVMDGFTAAKMIRQWEEDEGREKVDIYFVSGEYYSEEDVLRDFRYKIGHDGIGRIFCLKKPMDMLVVRKILSKYKVEV